jgi:hypothetical protein
VRQVTRRRVILPNAGGTRRHAAAVAFRRWIALRFLRAGGIVGRPGGSRRAGLFAQRPASASAQDQIAMDEFGYLSVLLSLIIGLAIAQLLQGFRGMALARSRVRLYPPTVAWSATLLLIAVQTWWSMFGLREKQSWSFLEFAVVLAQTILLYMLAGLALPDFVGDQEIDLGAHYHRHRRLLFGVAIATALVSLTKDLVMTGHLPQPANIGFHLFFIAAALTAILTRREWYHRVLGPVMFLMFCLYIGLLFTRLPG